MTRIMLIMLGLALAVSCANKQQMALLRSDVGDRHSEQGAYEAAIAAYQEAIALDPKNPSSRINLGKVYVAMERFDEAAGLLRSAVELNPADGAAQALLVQLELARGRYPGAWRLSVLLSGPNRMPSGQLSTSPLRTSAAKGWSLQR